jgi:mannose-6-phosphate isomerase-like protein (cupin superfamily)
VLPRQPSDLCYYLAAVLAHWDDVEWARIDIGPLQGASQRLGAAAGAARAGLSRYRMSPGERAMPVHVHADEEEIFYVLGGSGLSWQDARTDAVTAGDCVVHRRSAEAHTIVAEHPLPDGPDSRESWISRAAEASTRLWQAIGPPIA